MESKWTGDESLDKEQIKAAIREELGRKVAMSGGPEVFRRLVRGSSPLVETALQDLVNEGLLSETRLRVGRIYHYPANTAVRLDILAGFMKKAAEAPARPARDPNAPRPVPRAAAPAPVRTPSDPPTAPATESEASDGDLAGVRTTSALVLGNSQADVVRTPANRETASPASEPSTLAPTGVPDASGEKPAWVPKKAAPRDPNKPRPVPRVPAASPASAAATTDPDARGPSPERVPEGPPAAAETPEVTAPQEPSNE